MQMPQWDFAMAFFRCFPKQSCSIARATVQEGSPASPQLAEAGGSARQGTELEPPSKSIPAVQSRTEYFGEFHWDRPLSPNLTKLFR